MKHSSSFRVLQGWSQHKGAKQMDNFTLAISSSLRDSRTQNAENRKKQTMIIK